MAKDDRATLNKLPKETKALVITALQQGWVCEQGRKHWKLKSPGGDMVVFSCTRIDYRATRNMRAELRRRGVVFP